MVDIEYIKATLNPTLEDDRRKIKQGDYLTKEVIDLLCTGKVANIQKCFALTDGTSEKYTVECVCSKCNSIHTLKKSKTKLLEYIADLRNGINNYKCEICKELEAEESKKLSEQNKILLEKATISATETFISNYLCVGYDINDKSDKQFYAMRNQLYRCDIDAIADYINDMDYHDFLITPYWRIIARHMKKKAKYKCQLCNSKGQLNVHHRTYDNHGYELTKCEEDLICLCQDCHEKFHE